MNKEKNNGINKDESIDSEKENPEELESEEESPSLEEEIESLKDQVLRAKAEVQNVRRVAEQEVRKARLYGVESLAKNFLSVGDNLERAIESLNEDSKPEDLEEGLRLILKSYEDALETGGIISIDPKGEPFNPEQHEALSVIENEDLEPNSIIEVIQRGFMIQDRVLRPAKVIVTKKN
ncbi:MAG: nucleotide exchange factor GrpE [Pseudomonadota bacterium]|nr:nucleotide exchange factor GrpE [Pseudomonadota bacterium]